MGEDEKKECPQCGVSTERIVVCMIELSSFWCVWEHWHMHRCTHTNTHTHIHSHMQRGFGVLVLWMSRWLTRAGMASYFDGPFLFFIHLFFSFSFFSSLSLWLPSSISSRFHSAAASNQTHKCAHTQCFFLVCTEYTVLSHPCFALHLFLSFSHSLGSHDCLHTHTHTLFYIFHTGLN